VFGCPAPVDALVRIASRLGLLVVEDAAQAHLARGPDGAYCGTVGTLGIFSFYPTKNMTTGEGGIIATQDPELAAQARRLRNQGLDDAGQPMQVGYNLRMTDIAAAIGSEQLAKLSRMTAARRANADYLGARLNFLARQGTAPGATHVYHQFVVEVDDPGGYSAALRTRDVESRPIYPRPVHMFGLYRDRRFDLPVTERLSARSLALPVGPHLSPAQLERIVEGCVECREGH
jgi:dTDP-4-amino-4,6-dideoxygalactose transaminase